MKCPPAIFMKIELLTFMEVANILIQYFLPFDIPRIKFSNKWKMLNFITKMDFELRAPYKTKYCNTMRINSELIQKLLLGLK
jgi:hypothetical protein